MGPKMGLGSTGPDWALSWEFDEWIYIHIIIIIIIIGSSIIQYQYSYTHEKKS